MSVSSVGSTGSTSSTTTTTSTSTAQQANLDYNSFLKLMLQQMKDQDPTHPVDQTQMLAQLAQFSAVGQSIQTNTKLDTLISSANTQAAVNLIGKTVTSLTDGTTGTVKSIEITSTGSTAILTSGSKIDLSTGIQVGS
jgi:flagellar basal-body rod modification protein FlgD